MALIKFIERFVVEKHRAMAFERERERPCHIRTVQAQCHISWQLLVTTFRCLLPLSNVGAVRMGHTPSQIKLCPGC